MSKSEKIVAVYEAANEAEAFIIQGILKDNGIFSILRPRSPLPSAYAPAYIHGAVSVMVPGNVADEARELIASDSNGEIS